MSLPLCLPVDEAERGVNEPAHLSQRPLMVNTDEEVWGRGVLEGHVHHLSRPAIQIQKQHTTMMKDTGWFKIKTLQIVCSLEQCSPKLYFWGPTF